MGLNRPLLAVQNRFWRPKLGIRRIFSLRPNRKPAGILTFHALLDHFVFIIHLSYPATLVDATHASGVLIHLMSGAKSLS